MGDWESIFKKKGKFFHEPHEDMRKLAQLFKKSNVKKILDLGCGSGRHTVFFAKLGFDVYGMDSSQSGLKQTKEWLQQSDQKATLIKASCYEKFPYKDNFFDAIISVQVIHHAKIEEIQFCVSEIERTLKPDGIAFITVPKTKKNKFRSKVKMIAPRTFVPLDGHEIGLPHYHFNKEILKKSFRNFKILRIYTDNHKHYCLLGRLKEIAP